MLVNETYPIHYWESPHAGEIGETPREFLEQLEGPTWIYLPGKDQRRCRVVSTLLHGNEPSGLYALHDWLRCGEIPATDLYCFVGSVKAAQHSPGFHYRMLPGHRDLNRCFRPPFTDTEGLIAADLIHRLSAVQPEAVLDIHNTSGAGPSFAVVTSSDPRHIALCSLFTAHLVITDLRLGALMEFAGVDFPVTTIECGGCHDPNAHQLAIEGFKKFAKKTELFDSRSLSTQVAIYKHPLRVELIAGAEIGYAAHAILGPDLTLHNDVERYNFGVVAGGTVLGWLGDRGLGCLMARDALGREHIEHYFSQVDNQLVTRQNLKLFMITKNPDIAMSDCIFYLVPVNETDRHSAAK